MFQIVEKKLIAPGVTMGVILAPEIARSRKAGQFVILRFYEKGERIPLTIAGADADKGTIRLIWHPTHIEKYGHVVCIGGGIGIAPIHPIAQAMKEEGNRVTSILGGRTKDFVILEDWMRRVSDSVFIATDDGSYCKKGFVTDVLKERVDEGDRFDLAVAIGPVPMMNAVSQLTKTLGIPTYVSLNAIMVDGTGMCGACRITVGGKTRFVCVDGPEFDGHLVDFKQLMHRLNIFKEYEARAMEQYNTEKGNPDCIKKRAF